MEGLDFVRGMRKPIMVFFMSIGQVREMPTLCQLVFLILKIGLHVTSHFVPT
jgi:hypothetical protein